MKKYIVLITALTAFIPLMGQTFMENGINFQISDEDSGKCMVVFSESYGGDLDIPETVAFDGKEYVVAGIADYAFAGCDDIKAVTIPHTVVTVGRNAFQGCSAIEKVVLPEAVTEIGEQTFYGCVALQTFEGKGVGTIGASAFGNCRSLETIQFGNLEQIGQDAFSGCSSMEEFIMPEGVDLGTGIFYGCTSLKVVTLPSGIEEIPMHMFNGCISLKEICNTEDVLEIGDYAFYTCSALKTYPFGHDIEMIGRSAFSFCVSLDVEEICGNGAIVGESAFAGCSSLENIKLSGIYELGEDSFANATSLVTICFDNTIHYIRERAFRNCKLIAGVKCEASQPPFLANNSFMQPVFSNAMLSVPEGAEQIYRQTPPWSYFINVEEYEQSSVHKLKDENDFSVFTDGTCLTVSGREGFLSVVTLDGMKIFEGRKEEGDISLNLHPAKKMYIITLNGHSVKAAVPGFEM